MVKVGIEGFAGSFGVEIARVSRLQEAVGDPVCNTTLPSAGKFATVSHHQDRGPDIPRVCFVGFQGAAGASWLKLPGCLRRCW